MIRLKEKRKNSRGERSPRRQDWPGGGKTWGGYTDIWTAGFSRRELLHLRLTEYSCLHSQ